MSYYSLMTQLPELPSVPGKPPLSLQTLIAILQEELTRPHWDLARILLLRLDVANLEAIICGTPQLFDHRALFTPDILAGKVADGDEYLPGFMEDVLRMLPERAGLVNVIGQVGHGSHQLGSQMDRQLTGQLGDSSSSQGGSISHQNGGASTGLSSLKDQLWRGYFQFVDEEASSRNSLFLSAWLEFEVSLLNGLLQLRKRLNAGDKLDSVDGGSISGGVVDKDNITEATLEEPLAPASHHDLLLHVVEMDNPMERERLLDEARLFAMDSIPVMDPFSADAVLVYLARMLVLDKWDLPQVAHIEKMLEVF